MCCPEFHKASAKRSVHNKEKQALYHPSSLDIQRALREIFVDCSKRYFLVFLQFTDECCVNTFALQQRTRKPLNGRCNTPSLPLERSFSELMTLFDIDLLCMRWDDERILQVKRVRRWSRLSDSLSNWPESCSFSSAQLGYLNLISVYKSIWGFVFILVCWECWGKRESIIHNSLNLTDDRSEMIEKMT